MITSQEYSLSLMAFVQRLKADQDRGMNAKGIDIPVNVYFVTGRRYDKVFINESVRYFIDHETGIIYGAKSPHAPNLKWYFGSLDRVELWDWSDDQGVPINDDTARFVKKYGPYRQYIKI